MNKLGISIAIVVILGLGAFVAVKKSHMLKQQPTITTTPTTTVSPSTPSVTPQITPESTTQLNTDIQTNINQLDSDIKAGSKESLNDSDLNSL